MIHSERKKKKVGALRRFSFLYLCVFGFDWEKKKRSACEYISRLPISGMWVKAADKTKCRPTHLSSSCFEPTQFISLYTQATAFDNVERQHHSGGFQVAEVHIICPVVEHHGLPMSLILRIISLTPSARPHHLWHHSPPHLQGHANDPIKQRWDIPQCVAAGSQACVTTPCVRQCPRE